MGLSRKSDAERSRLLEPQLLSNCQLKVPSPTSKQQGLQAEAQCVRIEVGGPCGLGWGGAEGEMMVGELGLVIDKLWHKDFFTNSAIFNFSKIWFRNKPKKCLSFWIN